MEGRGIDGFSFKKIALVWCEEQIMPGQEWTQGCHVEAHEISPDEEQQWVSGEGWW